MSEQESDLLYLTLCTFYHAEDDEDLESAYKSALRKGGPEELVNRDIYFEEDEIGEFEAVYSTGEPELPDQADFSESVFQLSAGSDEESLHVHSYIRPKNKEEVLNKHIDVLSCFDEISVGHLDVVQLFDESLDTILPDWDPEVDNKASVDSITFETEVGDLTLTRYYGGVHLLFEGPDTPECSSEELEELVEETIAKADKAKEEVGIK